jgi:hypothetical protein
MIDGETVEIRYQGEDWWFVGTVYCARKLQVELTGAVDADTHAPDSGQVADENTIAEWRRPGTAESFRNPLVHEVR